MVYTQKVAGLPAGRQVRVLHRPPNFSSVGQRRQSSPNSASSANLLVAECLPYHEDENEEADDKTEECERGSVPPKGNRESSDYPRNHCRQACAQDRYRQPQVVGEFLPAFLAADSEGKPDEEERGGRRQQANR
jgi:hypothetical protein